LLGGNSQPQLPYANQISGQAGTLGSQGLNVSQQGQGYLTQASDLSPTVQQAIQSYMSTLQQDPYTSAYDANTIANENAGISQGYNQQESQTEAALNAAGLTQPGGVSSPLSGVIAGFGNARAGANAQAQAQLAQQSIQQQLAQQGLAAQVGQGYQSQLFNQGLGAANTGANIQGMSLQDLLALQAQYGQANQAQAGASGGLGSVLGAAASFIPGL
jgi:hypothetical protein